MNSNVTQWVLRRRITQRSAIDSFASSLCLLNYLRYSQLQLTENFQLFAPGGPTRSSRKTDRPGPTATFVFDIRAATPYPPPAYPAYHQEAAHVTSLSECQRRLCHSHV